MRLLCIVTLTGCHENFQLYEHDPVGFNDMAVGVDYLAVYG